MSWRSRAAVLAGRASGTAVRRLGRGGGTALPGLIAGRIAPDLLARLGSEPGYGAVMITGTNGKTTTTHLVSSIARAAGLAPLTNSAGSNLERGLAAAYVDESTIGGRLSDAERRLAVLEVDEAVLPGAARQIGPRVMTFLNLFRDQLDRYGEVHAIAARWRALLDERDWPGIVVNADDPGVAVLGESVAATSFGIDDPAVLEAALASTVVDHASDARFCSCGGHIEYDALAFGHLGHWRCNRCTRRRPVPTVTATRVQLGNDETKLELEVGGEPIEATIRLAGLHSVYNALAAAATAHAVGLPTTAIAEGLNAASPAFGRQERLTIELSDGPRETRLLLAKNPTGLNEVLRLLIASPERATALLILNDGIQDGRDVSWIYDADLEMLAQRPPVLLCAGRRAHDLALRCAIAGVPPVGVEPDIAIALDQALAMTAPGGRLEVVPTYTAMLEVRELIARRAGARRYWERAEQEQPA
jgi:UDP-N-acetylmuramyl tripeptide synthase